MRSILVLLLAAVLCVLAACSSTPSTGSASASSSQPSSAVSAAASSSAASASKPTSASVVENGEYTSKDDVGLYLHLFGHLPSNYVTKNKARKAGWVSTEGNLWNVLPGKSIGGDTFYNDDGQLPDSPGRKWAECDIDYSGGFRGAKRIVFSNDGLVFYTADHYKTFEQLY